MIVTDACVLANYLADDGSSGDAARRELTRAGDVFVPDLVDVETAAVLRKRWIAKAITDRRFADTVDIVAQLPFHRYPTSLFLRRAYELRQNVSAYDSVYVALAETLDCELLTCDRRLARATGPRCPIRVLQA